MASAAQKAVGAAVTGITGLGLLGYGAYSSVFFVDGGHRAVKFNRIYGVTDRVYGEGMHFLVPWFEKATIYDVRAMPRNIASLTGTKDLQMVNIALRVLSKPTVSRLPHIHRHLGPDYDERVLPSIVNEVLKSVVAQFNASQLITQRDRVSKLIRENLIERAHGFNIEMDDVAITHVTFSQEFSKAVEAKQVAQQDAQRATFIVERAKQEREQIIVKSQGEALSAQMVGEAIKNNPGFLQLRRLEAAREIAVILRNSTNKVYLDASSLLLNVADDKLLKESLGTSAR